MMTLCFCKFLFIVRSSFMVLAYPNVCWLLPVLGVGCWSWEATLGSVCATCLGWGCMGARAGKGRVGSGNRVWQRLGWWVWAIGFLAGMAQCLLSLTRAHIHQVALREMPSGLWLAECLYLRGQGLVYRHQTLLFWVVLPLCCPGPIQLPKDPISNSPVSDPPGDPFMILSCRLKRISCLSFLRNVSYL